jgi:uncharacterized protein with PIN domain
MTERCPHCDGPLTKANAQDAHFDVVGVLYSCDQCDKHFFRARGSGRKLMAVEVQ